MAQVDDDEDEDETADDDSDTEDSSTSSDDSDEDDDEDDSEEEAPAAKVAGNGGAMGPPASAAPPTAAPSAPATNTPDPAAMKAYLAQKYDEAGDNSGVQAAQEQARSDNMRANIGSALESLARSNSMAHGGQGVDESFYKGIREQGQQGVANAQANRQADINSFLQKNELQRQVVEDMMAKGTYDQKATAFKIAMEQQDPNSQSSKNKVTATQHLFPGALDGLDTSKISGADIDDINKQIDIKQKGNLALQEAGVRAAMMRAGLEQKIGEKNKEQDIAFNGKFQALQQKYNATNADLDKQNQMIDQAAGSQGGIAGQLVRGSALHQALGRVSQGELSMAQDPALMNRATALFQKIDTGQTLTPKDIEEYKSINAATRASNDAAFQTNAQQLTDSNDRAAQHPSGYSASIVGLNQKPTGQKAASAPPPTPSAGTKVINGVTYQKVQGGWKKMAPSQFAGANQ